VSSSEYLDIGSGGPLPPAQGRSSTRRTVLVSAGVIGGVALLGAGAWAAWSFFSTGPQPAEALPASTLAYASIDLDPSGGQKIEALRTLQKFPAFEDEIGLDTDDDVRQWVFEQFQDSGACADLDYDDDVEPWLGDRFAVAAVDAGDDEPAPVFVVQVTDANAADAGLSAVFDCGDEDAAWSITDGWALVAQSREVVDRVAADAEESTLADDGDFTTWTNEAGGAGIATVYLAPDLGELLAEHADEWFGYGVPEGFATSSDSDFAPTGYAADDAIPDELTDELKDFRGAAATLRFDDGSLELEAAGDTGKDVAGSDAAGDLVAGLPEDTALALGLGFADGWLDGLLDDDLLAELGASVGLDLPDDAETLLGEAAVLSIGGDLDPQTFFDSPDGSGVPIGLTVQGDREAIEGVLDRLRSDGGEALLASDGDGDLVAIGPDADYRALLLADGDLGSTDAFRDAVPDADDAAAIAFVSFDAGEWLDHLAQDASDLAENLRPLAALGLTGSFDGDTSHLVLRVTTD
jgi:hypothetical protein